MKYKEALGRHSENTTKELEIIEQLLWSDPKEGIEGWEESERGAGIHFGPDLSHRFLSENNLSFIIRSHEWDNNGYKVNHNDRVITVFSASFYAGEQRNKGAIIHLSLPLSPLSPSSSHPFILLSPSPSRHPPLSSFPLPLSPSLLPSPLLSSIPNTSSSNINNNNDINNNNNNNNNNDNNNNNNNNNNDNNMNINNDKRDKTENGNNKERDNEEGKVEMKEEGREERKEEGREERRVEKKEEGREEKRVEVRVEQFVASAFAFDNERQSMKHFERITMQKLIEKIFAHRNSLFSSFHSLDINKDGKIKIEEWDRILKEITKLEVPWISLSPYLSSPVNGHIQYVKFLDRFKVYSGDDFDDWKKKVNKMIAREINARYDDLEEAFREGDKDQNGSLSYPEFSLIIQSLKINLSSSQIFDLMISADHKYKGSISFFDFVSCFRKLNYINESDKLVNKLLRKINGKIRKRSRSLHLPKEDQLRSFFHCIFTDLRPLLRPHRHQRVVYSTSYSDYLSSPSSPPSLDIVIDHKYNNNDNNNVINVDNKFKNDNDNNIVDNDNNNNNNNNNNNIKNYILNENNNIKINDNNNEENNLSNNNEKNNNKEEGDDEENVTYREFRMGVKKLLNLHVDKEKMRILINYIDKKTKGMINITTFSNSLKHARKIHKVKKWKENSLQHSLRSLFSFRSYVNFFFNIFFK